MNEQLIRDLAITGGIYDCITDPYDKLNNGDPYSSVMPDLARFAELIVAECLGIVDDAERGGSNDIWDNAVKFIRRDLQEHFGVDP
jgi:hypothetical protein